MKAFAKEFGYPRDNRDYCVFSFEPNPKFEQRHLDLQEAYRAVGWKYTPIFAGASNANGNFTFYHSAFEKEEWETGFSAVTPKTLYGHNATAKTVSIIRLSSWIQNEIIGRLIPTTQYSEIQSEYPKIMMKLDIEELEFTVFPDLLTTGVLCNHIDFLMGAFHHSPANHNYDPINLTSNRKHVLDHRREGEALAREMLRLVDITDSCKTQVSLEDDESYLTDPHGYPKPKDNKIPNQP